MWVALETLAPRCPFIQDPGNYILHVNGFVMLCLMRPSAAQNIVDQRSWRVCELCFRSVLCRTALLLTSMRIANLNLNHSKRTIKLESQKLPSPEVADPDIILSRCGGIACWASHISWKVLAKGRWTLDNFVFVHYLVMAQAFVAQLVQLVRPETSLTQTEECESAVWQWRMACEQEPNLLSGLMCWGQLQTFIQTQRS